MQVCIPNEDVGNEKNLTLEKKKEVSYNIINIHSSSEEEEQE